MCFVLTDSWSNSSSMGCLCSYGSIFCECGLLHSPRKLQTKPKVLTLTHDLPFIQANSPVSLIHCLSH